MLRGSVAVCGWPAEILVALVVASSSPALGATENLSLQTLYEFRSNPQNPNPKNPRAGLTQGNDGNFYGTTALGGTNGERGAVFQITPSGLLTLLHSFQGLDGALPWAGLAQGSDGLWYGTAQGGGTNGDFGVIFQMAGNGEFNVLHHFGGFDGRSPQAALVQGNDGSFYGTTAAGGTNLDNGTVFKITPSGVFTSLFSFKGTNGSRPKASLVRGVDGNFYGTTSQGGPDYDGASVSGDGTIFRITADGALTSLFFFNEINGSDPEADLVEGSDGNFYGTTQFGGSGADSGTVFKLTPSGTFTKLYAFSGQDGSYPLAGLTRDSDGNFYGTTAGDMLSRTNTFGTIFRLTPAGTLTTLVSFKGSNGASPVARLCLGNDGNLYGTAFDGGAGDGGTIFRLVEPLLIKAVAVTNGNVTLTWASFTHGTYRVEHNPSLTQATWAALVPEVAATNTATTITASFESAIHGFFRIRLLP